MCECLCTFDYVLLCVCCVCVCVCVRACVVRPYISLCDVRVCIGANRCVCCVCVCLHVCVRIRACVVLRVCVCPSVRCARILYLYLFIFRIKTTKQGKYTKHALI